MRILTLVAIAALVLLVAALAHNTHNKHSERFLSPAVLDAEGSRVPQLAMAAGPCVRRWRAASSGQLGLAG
jgi:hypothetical protein